MQPLSCNGMVAHLQLTPTVYTIMIFSYVKVNQLYLSLWKYRQMVLQLWFDIHWHSQILSKVKVDWFSGSPGIKIMRSFFFHLRRHLHHCTADTVQWLFSKYQYFGSYILKMACGKVWDRMNKKTYIHQTWEFSKSSRCKHSFRLNLIDLTTINSFNYGSYCIHTAPFFE